MDADPGANTEEVGPSSQAARSISWVVRVLATIGVVAVLATGFLIGSPRVRQRVAAWLAGPATPTPGQSAAITYATVRRVLDGSTVELESGQVVRYLGIRAPSVRSEESGPPEPYGVEAREANRALVEGKRVALEADGPDTDAEDRLLRYVWVDQTFVNVALVRGGYAKADLTQPSLKYADLLRSAEEEARSAQRGLWSLASPVPQVLTTRSLPTPEPTVGATSTPFVCSSAVPDALPADQALKHVGEHRKVAFQVVRTYNSGSAVFLDSHEPHDGYFYVIIFPDLWNRFPDPPEDYFAGRCVEVEGQIGLFRGAPQILLRDPEQIKIIR